MAIKKHFKIDFVDLAADDVEAHLAKYPYRFEIDPEFCKKHLILPLWEKGEKTVVAVANPFDLEGITGIEMLLSRRTSMALCQGLQLKRALQSLFPSTSLEVAGQDDTEESTLELSDISSRGEETSSTEDANAAPIVKLTNRILLDAIRLEASDVHLEPTPDGMSVRFRIGGVLKEIINIPRKMQHHVTARYKILATMDIADRRKPQDGRFQIRLDGRKLDVRCSSIPVAAGEKVVLRILGGNILEADFACLGMPEQVELRVKDALHKKGKMFLVTGPTSSGKTTSLYVGINYLNDGSRNITTIEDPIEYKIKGVNQTQVNNLAGMTFAKALRSLLRQDPDVILIGEMRDSETVQVALQAAQTGHLVMSTLPTNDAVSVIGRLKDLGADSKLLGESLIGVLAQRLVRKLCPHCKCEVSDSDVDSVKHYLDIYQIDRSALRKGRGCDKCFYSGYKGRSGIFSYLHVNDAVSQCIFNQKHPDDIVAAASESGFQTLEEAGIALVLSGETTLDEVRAYLDVDGAEVRRKTSKSPDVSSSIDRSMPLSSVKKQRARVLVIDDNSSARKIVATLLRKEEVDVVEAQDGLEALQRVNESLPDLILCDLQMPKMNGKDFLANLKNNKMTKDVPVIMLTIDDKPENEIELLKLGASSFLSKRVSPNVLLSRIKRALEVV